MKKAFLILGLLLILILLALSVFKFLIPSVQKQQPVVGEKVFCKNPRPEVCTMECVAQPSYICGSDGKFYCNKCSACANPKVKWYLFQETPCEE